MSTSTPTTPKTLLTVLISGNGTNLQALIDACASPSSVLSNCTITHVVSNRKAAYGLVRAQTAGIPTTYHNLVPYTRKHLAAIPTPKPNDDTTPTDPEKTTQIEAAKASARAAYDADLAHLLLHPPTPPATKPHLIICAGWMHVLTPSFLDPIAAAGIDVINLHPALPGAYNGANAIARAYADWRAGKVDRTGVMVHRVVREVDMGLPLVVREVGFVEGDGDERGEGGLERVEERVHAVEWGVIVEGTAVAVREFWARRGRGEGEGKGEREREEV